MSKNKTAQKPTNVQDVHDEQMQALAQQVAEHDDVEIVAEVDIDNKAVSDVLIIRDSEVAADEPADKLPTDDADSDVAGDVADVVLEHSKELKQQALNAMETGQNKAAQVMDQGVQVLKDQAQQTKQTLEQTLETAQENLNAQKQTLLDKGDEIKQAVYDKFDELKDGAAVAQEQFAEKTQELKDEAVQKAQALKAQVQQTAESLLQTSDELKQEAVQMAQSAMHQGQDAALAGSVAMHDQAMAAKEKLQQLAKQGKTAIQEQIQALDEKYAASDKLTELSQTANQAAKSLKTELDTLQNSTEQSLQAAKKAGEIYDQTHAQAGLSGKLGKLGAYLSGLYGTRSGQLDKSYQAVNLEQGEFGQDAFHQQGSQFVGLFGAKAVAAQNLASKVIAQNKFEAFTDKIYNQVAKWSQAWAMKDLQKDARFGQLDELSDEQRQAFAKDIADQNRALATLGGVAGLAGLKGVVADMAWLLMVSLRSVYQLAAVYDKPLVGKQGIKQAYGVLSGANLEKLQEKQVVLTALALGSTMLANAQTTGLKAQLETLSARYRESQLYTKQFADLDKFVDLDKLNPSWLRKLLPLASVAAGVHYNNQLIDEVIGTAMATFAKPKIQLLDTAHGDLPNDTE